MDALDQPLSATILAFDYLGDVVCAMTGALAAGRHRMDVIGCLMIGTVTGIGGGTTRDLLLGRRVWWTTNPEELILCVAAAAVAYLFIRTAAGSGRHIVWLDAVGLSAFTVVGCHVALSAGAPFVVAVFMGMVTAAGGGMIRDLLTNTQPMILSPGELYATAALGGAFIYTLAVRLDASALTAQLLGFVTVLSLRGASIVFGVRTGPPGEVLRWVRPDGR
jgi:uncharacterized membrane protein YeiH